MAERVYTADTGMECPRCRSKKAAIAEYSSGTHCQVICDGCGMEPEYGKQVLHPLMAVAKLKDKFYSWIEANKKTGEES